MCKECNDTGKIRVYRHDLEEFEEIPCDACHHIYPENVPTYP